MKSADLSADLAALVSWARRSHVDLTGLEIAPPSLEDAYLSLTAEPYHAPADPEKVSSHD
jgi:ABC-2 type transport system ATP-binding protein